MIQLYKKKYSASDSEILEIIENAKKNKINNYKIDSVFNFHKTYNVYTTLNSDFISNSTQTTINSINYTYNINFDLYLPSDYSETGAFVNSLPKNVTQIELLPFNFRIMRFDKTYPIIRNSSDFCYVLIQNLTFQCYQDKDTKFHFKFDNYFSHNLTNTDPIYFFNQPVQLLSNIMLNFFHHNNLIYLQTDQIPIFKFIISLKFKCLY